MVSYPSFSVDQILSNPNAVNPWLLEAKPFTQKRELPSVAAIYFVLRADELLYISSSINLRKRWNGSGHRISQLIVDRHLENEIQLTWLRCQGNQRLYLQNMEMALIRGLDPLLNKTFKRTKDK